MPIECNQFFIPTNSIHTTRNFNPSNFKINVQHQQNYFRFSFFPRTVNSWNSLSKDLKITQNQTETALRKLLTNVHTTVTGNRLSLYFKGTVVNWDISLVTVFRH